MHKEGIVDLEELNQLKKEKEKERQRKRRMNPEFRDRERSRNKILKRIARQKSYYAREVLVLKFSYYNNNSLI